MIRASRIAAAAAITSSSTAASAPRHSLNGRASLLAHAGGRLFGKTFGEFAARSGRRDLAVKARAVVAQRLDAVIECRIRRRTFGARRPCIDSPNGEPRPRLALDS